MKNMLKVKHKDLELDPVQAHSWTLECLSTSGQGRSKFCRRSLYKTYMIGVVLFRKKN